MSYVQRLKILNVEEPYAVLQTEDKSCAERFDKEVPHIMIDRNFDNENPEQILLERFLLGDIDIFHKLEENRFPRVYEVAIDDFILEFFSTTMDALFLLTE